MNNDSMASQAHMQHSGRVFLEEDKTIHRDSHHMDNLYPDKALH